MSGVCALVSGGLDSAILLARLLAGGEKVLPVYVRCGLRWEKAELHWLKRLLRSTQAPKLMPLKIVDVPAQTLYGGAHWSIAGRRVPEARSDDGAVYLPGRNVLLIGLAAVICAQAGLSVVALGTLAGNPFGDASPEFFARYARVLALALGRPISIAAPLRSRSKSAWMRLHSRDVRLELTFSCLNPRRMRPCGACNKCVERQKSFRAAGIADPTAYVRKPT